MHGSLEPPLCTWPYAPRADVQGRDVLGSLGGYTRHVERLSSSALWRPVYNLPLGLSISTLFLKSFLKLQVTGVEYSCTGEYLQRKDVGIVRAHGVVRVKPCFVVLELFAGIDLGRPV